MVSYLTIVVSSVVVPLAAAIYVRKKFTPASKALFYFLIASGATDVIVAYYTYRRVDSRPGLHFYTVGELLVLSFFFHQVYTFKAKTKFVAAVALGFTTLSILNSIFIQPLSRFPTYARSLEAVIMVVFCFAYFEQEGRLRQLIRWEKKPNNWYVTGFLVYFAGALFFFIFSNVILRLSPPTQSFIWNLHGSLQIIMYLMFTFGYLNERGNR